MERLRVWLYDAESVCVKSEVYFGFQKNIQLQKFQKNIPQQRINVFANIPKMLLKTRSLWKNINFTGGRNFVRTLLEC